MSQPITSSRLPTGRIALGGIVLIGGLLALVIGFAPRRYPGADPAQIALGQQVYEQNCAGCHGLKGEGQPPTALLPGQAPAPAHDDSGHTWHHADAQLIQIVTQGGVFGMPAFGETLTDAEIAAALAYIKTFWTAEQREIQADISERYVEP
jgi:mono/diheme cytochrome c family protein